MFRCGGEQVFGSFDLADGEFQGGEVSSRGVAAVGEFCRGISQRVEQVAACVGCKRFGERGFVFVGESEIVWIQDAGIVEAPLNEIGGGQDGGELRRLAGGDACLLAAGEGKLFDGSFEFNRAIKKRQTRGGVSVGDGEEKFRAANCAGGERGLELHVGGILAVEEVKRAAFETEATTRRLRWRLNLDDRGLIDADDAAVGKAERGPAVGGGAETVAGVEELIRARGPPIVCGGERDFNFAGELDELAGEIGGGCARRWFGTGDGKHRAQDQSHPRTMKCAG